MKVKGVGCVGLALAFACIPVASASGRPVVHDKIDNDYNLRGEDFCGVPGLTITDVGHTTGRFAIKPEGRAGQLHFQFRYAEHGTVTNLSNGRFVTYRQATNGNDVSVKDNGDGTLTIVTLFTGPSTTYDEQGQPIVRNPGQHRERVVIDYNGTISNPDDDVFISGEILKESTGRNDDYCGPVLKALGVG